MAKNPRTIVVTGSASGMGAAARERLTTAGDRVIGVDLRDAEVVADLSNPEGRAAAIEGVLELADGRLDGAVMAAGLGPVPGRERIIAEVNFLGVADLLDGFRPVLAEADKAKVVVVGSNATTTTPLVPSVAVRLLMRRDIGPAISLLTMMPKVGAAFTYAASKLAVTHWARQQAVTPEWAGAGIRLNILAPGAVSTPLLEEQLAGPDADRIKRFPVPIGEFGSPEVLAQWMEFMLSPAADFLVGSFVVVDGGSDAFFRATDWPSTPGALDMPEYLVKMFGKSKH